MPSRRQAALHPEGSCWHSDYPLVRNIAQRSASQAQMHFQPVLNLPLHKGDATYPEIHNVASNCHVLGAELINVSEDCHHADAASDVSRIGSDLVALSFAICRVEKAMEDEPDQHSQVFVQDFLQLVRDLDDNRVDIAECSVGILDTAHPLTTVKGVTKEARIAHLLGHLHTLRQKLVSMNFVLLTSIDEAKGSANHVLAKDLSLYESILARTAGAALDHVRLGRANLEFQQMKASAVGDGSKTPHAIGQVIGGNNTCIAGPSASGRISYGAVDVEASASTAGQPKFTEKSFYDPRDQVPSETTHLLKPAAGGRKDQSGEDKSTFSTMMHNMWNKFTHKNENAIKHEAIQQEIDERCAYEEEASKKLETDKKQNKKDKGKGKQIVAVTAKDSDKADDDDDIAAAAAAVVNKPKPDYRGCEPIPLLPDSEGRDLIPLLPGYVWIDENMQPLWPGEYVPVKPKLGFWKSLAKKFEGGDPRLQHAWCDPDACIYDWDKITGV